MTKDLSNAAESKQCEHRSAYAKWTAQDDRRLVERFRSGVVVRVLAVELGRTENSIQTRLLRLGEIGGRASVTDESESDGRSA